MSLFLFPRLIKVAWLELFVLFARGTSTHVAYKVVTRPKNACAPG